MTTDDIRGDRVLLVQLPVDRVDAVLAGDLHPYTAGKGWPTDDTVAAMSFRAARGLLWLIVVDGAVVGDIGTKGPLDAADGVEIGYGLAAPHRGRGIGTSAAAALVEWLLTRADVRRVVAHVDRDNTPSVRLLRRLDFVRVGQESGEDIYERTAPS
jgi:RimJ/RimL family protein N-acetyltransferase